jgi:ubiquinone/menaquinone biosynthesis C-methylase UbiE
MPDQGFSFLTADPEQRLAALYNRLAPCYFLLHPVLRRIARHAAALLADAQGRTALDVCTGTGVLAEALLARGYRVTGADLSAQMLAQRRAGRQARGLALTQMDARRLAFADRSFDLCSISMGLHEFAPPDRAQVLAELARLSRRHILVADYSGPQSWPIRLIEWAEGSNYHDLQTDPLADQLQRAGLRVVKSDWRVSVALCLCEVTT